MKIFRLVKSFFTPSLWISFFKSLTHFLSFISVLFLYILILIIKGLVRFRFTPKSVRFFLSKVSNSLYKKATPKNVGGATSISRLNLIDLAFSNMKFKKTRTAITIGGMSIGVATIVFLISLGFGLEKLVTSKIARLDEMKQADVSTQPGSSLTINDKVLNDFKTVQNVRYVLPEISLVGKIKYKSSVSDMAVYGVTAEYLKQSAVKLVKGKIFDTNELSFDKNNKYSGSVAGVSDVRERKLGDELNQVEFSIYPNEWIKVRNGPSLTDEVIGYTKRYVGHQRGVLVYGEKYIPSSKDKDISSDWIKATVYIWEKGDDGEYKRLEENGYGVRKEGYFPVLNMTTTNLSNITYKPKVLGISDSKLPEESTTEPIVANAGGSDETDSLNIIDSGDGWVTIEGAGFTEDVQNDIQKIPIGDKAYKQAVVNRAFLKVLGINEDNAVGEKFDVSFVINGKLRNEANRAESEFVTYEIVGVSPQDDIPYFYVPFVDMKTLGIVNYSQAKLVSEKDKDLPDIRKKIEAMGFSSTSVTDTVDRVSSLFATIRIVFAVLGAVALAVASLGMFNTLTVSLLERTREIGLMKSMGMKSSEVKELFLTESMIMGVFGGAFGIFIGFLAGKIVSLVLTIIAINSGFGFINVSYVPFSLTVSVMLLSMFVGVITGFYPARRATRISALNALRYE